MSKFTSFLKNISFSWEKQTEVYLGESFYPNPIYRSEVDSRFNKRVFEKEIEDEELSNDILWRVDAKYKAVTIYCHIKTASKVPDKRELKFCILNFFDSDNNKCVLSSDPLIKKKKNGLLMIGDTDFTSNGESIESFSYDNTKTKKFKISSPYILNK